MSVDFIILAAGNSKRISSGDIPKHFLEIAGFPIIRYIIECCREISPNIIVVAQEKYKDNENLKDCKIAIQKEALGTADAVKAALPFVKSEFVIVICGDTPLINQASIGPLVDSEIKDVSFIAMYIPNDMIHVPYGRVFINEEINIIEYNDATLEQKYHNLVNTGVYKFRTSELVNHIGKIKINPAKNEYYLTDIFSFLDADKVDVVIAKDYRSFIGVNTPSDMIMAEQIAQERLREKLINNGVIMRDPSTIYLSHDTVADPLSVIEQNVIIKKNVKIKAKATVKAFSYLENCEIAENAQVGPFAVITGNSKIGENAVIGNFVEVKRSVIGKATKSKHLTYIGDTTIGENSNIGAGTITCNYDGVKKHPTKIGNKVMVGANSSLVAPVEIHDNSTIAAGSVITEDVPSETLAFGRARQVNKIKKS